MYTEPVACAAVGNSTITRSLAGLGYTFNPSISFVATEAVLVTTTVAITVSVPHSFVKVAVTIFGPVVVNVCVTVPGVFVSVVPSPKSQEY
ncbi:hypothetical protein D3C86_1431120 [compost metagenome]